MKIYAIICPKCKKQNFKYVDSKPTCQDCEYVLTDKNIEDILHEAYEDFKNKVTTDNFLSFKCYECRKETTTPIPRGLWQKKKYEFKCDHCKLPYKAITYKNGKVSITRTEMPSNKSLNKVYYFCDPGRDGGLFIAAHTWKEARDISLTGDYDMLAYITFPEIQGELLKDSNGKPYRTEHHGQLELYQLDELGIPYTQVS